MAAIAPANAKLFGNVIDKATGKESAEKVEPYDFAAGAQAQASKYVDVARGSKFKSIKKIGIVNFAVEFTQEKSANDSGLSIEKKLPAPSTAELQVIVDRLYAQVQADFKTQGIEVVPFEILKAAKNYEKLAPAQHASPWSTDVKDAKSIFIAPSGMPLYFDNAGRADLFKGLGAMFGTNTRMKEIFLVHELRPDMYLLSVNMVVDFATVKTSGGNVFGGGLGNFDVHHVQAHNTSFRFVSNTQPEFIVVKLKKTLVSDRPLWSNVTESTTKPGFFSLDLVRIEETKSMGTFETGLYYQRSEQMMKEAAKMFFIELGNAK